VGYVRSNDAQLADVLAPSAEGLRRLLLEVGMVVAVALLQLLDGHAESSSGFPQVGAGLHLPRSRGMAE
jgi:hypothetical protein